MVGAGLEEEMNVRLTLADPKACPFCGSVKAPAVFFVPGCWWVACVPDAGGCGAGSHSRKTRRGAIAAWNRRAAEKVTKQ